MRPELFQRLYQASLNPQDWGPGGPLRIDEGVELARPPPRGLILPIAQPVIDLYGTHRLHPQERRWSTTLIGATDSETIQSAIVPPSELWYILAADISHNSVAATPLRFSYMTPLGSVYEYSTGFPSGGDREICIASTGGTAVASGVHLVLPRPIYLGSGWRLRGIAGLIGAAETMTLNMLFLRLRNGEYFGG